MFSLFKRYQPGRSAPSSSARRLPAGASAASLHAEALTATHPPELFSYQVAWRSVAYHTGSYLTRHQGAGSDFAGYAPLLASPDPRRVDVRASLRSVPAQLMVRTFQERGAIRVYALLDVSSSMRFEGAGSMRQQLTRLATAIAWSATQQGDAFGMLAADEQLHASLTIAPGYQHTLAQQVAQQLTAFWQSPAGHGEQRATALPLAAQTLGPQRALVFLISDFYWPASLLEATLSACAGHDVVPVVLHDPAAFEQTPAFGWAHLRDMESGEETSVLMRPALQVRMREHALQQRQALQAVLANYHTRPPLWLGPDWQATQLSQHLLETSA